MSRNKYKIGEIRGSQLMYAFGIGAIIDFPNISAIVCGLEDWFLKDRSNPINEDRLLAAIKNRIGYHVNTIHKPPIMLNEEKFSFESRVSGVPVRTFPRWLRCPICFRMCQVDDGSVRFKPDYYRSDRIRFVHHLCPNAKKNPPSMVPVRRLLACDKGHIDDFPWLYFVHGGERNCKGPLFWKEWGVSGAVDEIEIACGQCGAKRRLLEAFGPMAAEILPLKCSGNHPHLNLTDESCESIPKPIILGASNSWFSMVLTAISLPIMEGKIDELVDQYWDNLKTIGSINPDIAKVIIPNYRKTHNLVDFESYTDEEILEAVKRTANKNEKLISDSSNANDLKKAEWDLFAYHKNIRDQRMILDTMPITAKFSSQIASIKKIEKLKEVQALIGFSRLTSLGEFGDWDEKQQELRAPISRTNKVNWVPGNEIFGEGIFIEFNELEIDKWLAKEEVKKKEELFFQSHIAYRKVKGFDNPEDNFPGIKFILLHTFSHALMRQLSKACGYSHSSLRERMYSRSEENNKMAGVLIYTAAPDSEGTLGGLSSLAVSLGDFISDMLYDLKICSGDPHCSEHLPDTDGSKLHGAACHSCLFAPETSCESGNKYLDRSVIVPTFNQSSINFFEEESNG